jgi:hypothetical protein
MAQTVILRGLEQRALACALIHRAPADSVVQIAGPKRSVDQNAKLWAMLSDIARAKPEGRMWTAEAWKAAFMHAIGHEVQFGQALDGQGFFPLGYRTSRLSKAQFAALITVVQEYGDRHNVAWSEPHPDMRASA